MMMMKGHQPNLSGPKWQLLCLLCLLSYLGRTCAQPSGAIIGGQGDWKFEYRPLIVLLPKEVRNNVQDGHGLALDPEAEVCYYTFHPKKNYTQVLVRFSKTELPQLLGDAGGILSSGIPHGLSFEYDRGVKYLYHANNAQRVTKTKVNGDVVWTTDFSDWETRYHQYWPIRPTDAIPVPGTDLLLVADGYGSSWIHTLNKTTGDYIEGKSFGGRGSTTQPIFSLPHSISLDHEQDENSSATAPAYNGGPIFIVSDRSDNRLVWVTTDGDFVKEVHLDSDRTPLPCNVDNSHVDVTSGARVSVIPSLGHTYESLVNGSVSIYKNQVGSSELLLATIEIAQLLGHEGHQHPHDAIFLPSGDLVVCCWSGPPNPGQGLARGTISYWKRLPADSNSLLAPAVKDSRN
jgi:hypothetical protein